MSLVSVTTALEPFTNFDAIPENVLEAAKEQAPASTASSSGP